MFCQKCGKEIADNSKFCPACGAKQDVQKEVPVQTTVNPGVQYNGYSVNQVTMPENNSNKKNNLVGKIAVLAVAVVVLVVGIILVVNIVSSHSGAKSVVNRYIDAINDYNAEDVVECFSKNLLLDEDDFEDEVEDWADYLDNLKSADFEVDAEIKSEKDISDDNFDRINGLYDFLTWKEYYQDLYLNYDENVEVQTVKRVSVKLTCDYDEDCKDDVEDAAGKIENIKELTCINIDGDWYLLY